MPHPKRPPVFREDGTIEIRLTRGYAAIIDSVDVEQAQYNWSAVTPRTGLVYAARKEAGIQHYLHRDIINAASGNDTDHKDGDTLNNRRGNLREASRSINNQNRNAPTNNKSGFRGVSLHSNGKAWVATIDNTYLGIYSTPEEANAVRLEAERKAWGVQPRRRAVHGLAVEEP